MLSNARYPNTDWYSPNWTGPVVPSLLPFGQLAAIDVFNSAIGLAENDSTDPPGGSKSRHGVPRGVVVGIVVGGVCVLLILIVSFVIWLRRRRGSTSTRDNSSDSDTAGESDSPENSIDPFPSMARPIGSSHPHSRNS